MKEQETGERDAIGRNGSKDGIGRKEGSGREGQGRAGDSAPAELVLDAGGGMQRPPCLTYSEDTIADSAARRNPVRVDVPRARIIFDVEMDLEDQGPVCGRRPRVQAIPSAGCRAFCAEHARKCPMCHVVIFRHAGCDHMVCKCGHTWNWKDKEAVVSAN